MWTEIGDKRFHTSGDSWLFLASWAVVIERQPKEEHTEQEIGTSTLIFVAHTAKIATVHLIMGSFLHWLVHARWFRWLEQKGGCAFIVTTTHMFRALGAVEDLRDEQASVKKDPIIR